MKNIFLMSLLLFSINSCCKEEPRILGCNVENPLEDLKWLKELYDPNNYSRDNNSPLSNNGITYQKFADGDEYISFIESNKGQIYDCSGNKVCYFGGTGEDKCPSSLGLKKVITFEMLAPVE